jgi:hypothetical protein
MWLETYIYIFGTLTQKKKKKKSTKNFRKISVFGANFKKRKKTRGFPGILSVKLYGKTT